MAFAIIPDGHGFILHGELDMANEQKLTAAFDAVVGSGAPVTVDMRQLQVIDSSGIKAIIAAAKATPGACIILHGVHDAVQRVVHMTRLEEVPNLHVMPCVVGV
jgi:anti-anti-sigma factor